MGCTVSKEKKTQRRDVACGTPNASSSLAHMTSATHHGKGFGSPTTATRLNVVGGAGGGEDVSSGHVTVVRKGCGGADVDGDPLLDNNNSSLPRRRRGDNHLNSSIGATPQSSSFTTTTTTSGGGSGAARFSSHYGNRSRSAHTHGAVGSNSVSLDESTRFRSCASRWNATMSCATHSLALNGTHNLGGGASAAGGMSIKNSEYFFSMVTDAGYDGDPIFEGEQSISQCDDEGEWESSNGRGERGDGGEAASPEATSRHHSPKYKRTPPSEGGATNAPTVDVSTNGLSPSSVYSRSPMDEAADGQAHETHNAKIFHTRTHTSEPSASEVARQRTATPRHPSDLKAIAYGANASAAAAVKLDTAAEDTTPTTTSPSPNSPVARYVRAKLEQPPTLDLSVFRVGCDTCVVDKRPDFYLYDPATDVMLKDAKAKMKQQAAEDADMTHEGVGFVSGEGATADDGIPRYAHTTATPFSELLKPTCTWDLLHSVPNAVDKVNKGDVLYRFSAKPYKELSLEDRTEIASWINMTGFSDELVENDQPILDMVRNECSVGPVEASVEALAAQAERENKKSKKDNKGKGAAAAHHDPRDNPFAPVGEPAETQPLDIEDHVICVLRLIGIMPRVTSRDANVDVIMSPEFQNLICAPDEVLEHIDRKRTFRKVKNIIPFVFSFRFQMTGSEAVDEETMREHTHHHGTTPNRIVSLERTRKRRSVDSTTKSKAWYVTYDIPPRGISSITGKALEGEALRRQEEELVEARRLHAEAAAKHSKRGAKAKKETGKSTGRKDGTAPNAGDSAAESTATASAGAAATSSSILHPADDPIPERPGGVLCVHTVVIIRNSMPKVLSGMVDAIGNRMGKHAVGQIFNVRQFLYSKKMLEVENEGWSVMQNGGDFPDAKPSWM